MSGKETEAAGGGSGQLKGAKWYSTRGKQEDPFRVWKLATKGADTVRQTKQQLHSSAVDRNADTQQRESDSEWHDSNRWHVQYVGWWRQKHLGMQCVRQPIEWKGGRERSEAVGGPEQARRVRYENNWQPEICNNLFFLNSITKYITEYFNFTQLHYQLDQ